MLCHVPNEVSKATVVPWGCVIDKLYDLKYPSKRWIHWRPINHLKVLKSDAKFVICQLLQVLQVEFVSHDIHPSLEVEWETEGTLRSYIHALVSLELVVSGATVMYQFADQVRILLR